MCTISDFAEKKQNELFELVDTLCRIPSPSHHEDARAEFCRKYWEDAGARNVTIDKAKNVVLPFSYNENGDNILFLAHTDTVFPDTKPFAPRLDGEYCFCPGIGDDTAHLSILLLTGKYILQNKILPEGCGVILSANSCEEGLGNLKGIRQLMADYPAVSKVISFDANLPEIDDRCVGSIRYKVTVKTKGGHSFRDFGSENAISALSALINDLYSYIPPIYDGSVTTYNVGAISGGTSVNTIAQNAEMLFEYRSDKEACLKEAMAFFNKTIETHKSDGISIDFETIGIRPCMSEKIDMNELSKLSEHCASILRQNKQEPTFNCSSTDCNIPLSQGVPAVAMGLVNTGGAHTREEWIYVPSLKIGAKIALELVLSYFT
ncbi:MAG: M20/M25/M40 family metallo-hydrolase [Ruminococcaceae bacterium]|nr:M20/M25/M40 family metallo-hydrolase [Oscillospiraceae bacterium]